MHIVRSNPKAQTQSESNAQGPDDNKVMTIEITAETSSEAASPRAARHTFSSKGNLTVFNTISVNSAPISVLPSSPSSNSESNSVAQQNVTDAIHSVALTKPSMKSAAQSSSYSVNEIQSYLQPYPIARTSPRSSFRRTPGFKLPWLECGGGLMAFTIISGVVAIDGLKQANLAPRPTAQTTRPSVSAQPSSSMKGTPMSSGELINSGRTLPVPNRPVPNSGTSFPQQQVALNPVNLSSGLNANAMNIVGNDSLESLTKTPVQTSNRPEMTANTGANNQGSRKAIAAPESNPIQESSKPKSLPRPNGQTIQQPTFPENPAFTPQPMTNGQSETLAPVQPIIAQPTSPTPVEVKPALPSKDAQLRSVPGPTSSSEVSPLGHDPVLLPVPLKQDSTISASSPVTLEANPQPIVLTQTVTSVPTTTDQSLKLEVSKLE
jgi:hypothetical protein